MQSTTKKHRRAERAPRVVVPNKEQAIIAFGAQRAAGVLCKLSATGGTLRLAKRVPRGTVAELTLKATSGTITSAIEFLAVADGGTPPAQAFRFIHMPPAENRRLENTLEEMRKQGFGEKKNWKFHPVARVALRTLRSITQK
jgi:hypothetical protein